MTTTKQRKKIYQSALKMLANGTTGGMCWVIGISTHKGKNFDWDDIESPHFPEFHLLHPIKNGDRFNWNISSECLDKTQENSLRQTILAFCIAICE
jgi:hypothetical protein